jgi:membrane-bound serine protease (ClpP class)
VREGVSLSARQALAQNVIDLVAGDVAALLKAADGRTVKTVNGELQLATAGSRVEHLEPDWRIKLLSVLTNPTVAYILMLIGIYGLLLEGYSPGAILPGVVGAISLLLALYAFQMLPVNYVGLALILLGVALMVGEALAPSFGVLGIGGAAAFVLGSILLMDVDVPGYEINLGVIIGVALSAIALLAATLYLLWRARHSPLVTGEGGFSAQAVVALESIDGEGWAELAGERWRVRSSRPLARGQRARVIRRDGLRLDVEPLEPGD